MKNIILISFVLLSTFNLRAEQETGHYVSGVEGIKAATVPGPGLYYKMYNSLYVSDKLTNAEGDDMNLDFELTVFSSAHRIIYISKKKILGADFGVNIIIPVVSTNISIGSNGVNDSQFNLADITIEPLLLGWHKRRYDLVFALAAVVPSGKYNITEPASVGKGMWTGLLTFGATYYPDKNKTWSVSSLFRFETHSEKKDYKVTPGDDFHFEWGISKSVPKDKIVWDFGVTGYAGWQISDDHGKDVIYDSSVRDRQFAVGPEISLAIPKSKLVFSLRSQKEFGVHDRSEGNMSTLSLVKIF